MLDNSAARTGYPHCTGFSRVVPVLCRKKGRNHMLFHKKKLGKSYFGNFLQNLEPKAEEISKTH